MSLAAARAPMLAILGLLLPLMAATAQARSDKPALHWVRGTGAQSCIDPRSLAQRVEDITGPAFVPAAQADVSIEARIEADEHGAYTLYMRLISRAAAASGERVLTFKTGDCRTLDTSIAFLIATAIDPTLGAEGVPPELSWVDESETAGNAESLRRELAAQPPAPEAPAIPEAPAPKPEQSSNQPAEPRLWRVGLAAIGGNGPDALFATGLTLELSRSLGAQLSVAAQLSGESALTPRKLAGNRSVLTQLAAAALLACLQLPLAPGDAIRACAGPELGAMFAHGRGFESNMTSVLSTAGALARIDLRRDIARDWTITVGASLRAVVLRPHVNYQTADQKLEAFRATPWLLQLAVGVVYRL